MTRAQVQPSLTAAALLVFCLVAPGCRALAGYESAPGRADGQAREAGSELDLAHDSRSDGAPDAPADAAADAHDGSADSGPAGPDGPGYHDGGAGGPCSQSYGRLYAPPVAGCGRWVWHSPEKQVSIGPELWPFPRNTLRAVHAFSATDVWAVGRAGTVLRNAGGLWKVEYVGGTVDLRAVWGSSPNDVWIGGTQGTLLHVTPSGRKMAILPSSNAVIEDLWGRAADDVWAATSDGPYHFDGARWRRAPAAVSVGPLVAITGLPMPGEIAAAGVNTLWRFDGSSWQSQAVTSGTLKALALLGNVTLAAGSKGTMLLNRGGGTAWANLPANTSALDDIHGLGARATPKGPLFFLGQAGRVRRLQADLTATSWAWDADIPVVDFGGRVHDISAWTGGSTSSESAWLVGEGGWAVHPAVATGPATNKLPQPGAVHFQRIAVAGDGHLYGAPLLSDSHLYRLAGPTYPFTKHSPGLAAQSVWALSATQVWTGNSFGVLYFSGASWNQRATANGGPVVDLCGTITGSGTEVWALTASGKAIERQQAWQTTFSGVKRPLEPPQFLWTYQRIHCYPENGKAVVVVAGGGRAWRRSSGGV
jgi:hypothetical protein